MFYVYNDISNSNNKKNFNPYREALKNLVDDIKNTDFNVLINTNVYIQSDICSDIDKIVLNIYSMKNINYKSIEKEFNNLYKKYGLLNLLNLYVVSVNQILDSYLFNNVVEPSKRVYILDDMDTYYKSCALLSKISLYSVIINNDLLNYKIDYMLDDKNKKDYRIVKDLKRENISLAKGLYDVPIFLTTKDARLFKNSLSSNKLTMSEIRGYMNTYTVLLFQSLTEIVFFKDEYKKYFNFQYDYDIKKLYKKKIFSIDHNVIKLRKVLPPKGGIVLKIKDDDDIESIYFNEKEDLNNRAIGGVVRYTDGTEEDFIFILNSLVSSSIFCTCSEKVFIALLLFYEVEYEIFNKVLNKYGKIDFEVLSPYYWRYRKNNYETNKEKKQRLEGKKIKREFTVNISSFIRKIKGNPSKEAQELAEKLCVKLNPNHTIVKEHQRTYNKNNSEGANLNKILDIMKKL